jgi:UDP-3-O-[3-hydroxymyristoyl] glucosamine N-acyltransferase
MPATLSDLAARFGCELRGEGEKLITGVGTLTGAGSDALAFLANPLYRSALEGTTAGAVVLAAKDQDACPVAALVCENPYAAYARMAAYLHPPPPVRPGIDPSACVAGDAVVAESASVGPQAVIGSGSRIGEAVAVGPGCVVGSRVRLGGGTRLAARVTVLDNVVIGERCLLHPGVVIGADGFGFARDGAVWVKVPQTGGVTIGNDVEIGANTTIDRGTIEETVIGDGVKLDNLIQIAHNVHVGEHTVMAAMAGAAGSAKIGKRCVLAGGAVIVGHVEICDDVMITFRAAVTRSIRKPGVYSACLPADEAPRWRRNAARFKRLDSYARRLRSVERRIETLDEEPTEKRRKHD